MELSIAENTREDLINSSKDEEGFIQQSLLIDEVMPLLLDTKVVDTENINHAYYLSSDNKIKINGYSINSTGERLQLFIVHDNYLTESSEGFYVSQRSDYEEQFKRSIRLVTSALQNKLENVQESEPIKPLISKLASEEGFTKFDVVEVFLITLSATVTFRSEKPQLRSIYFKEELKPYSHKTNDEAEVDKEFLLFGE